MTCNIGLFLVPGADALVREVCAAEGIDPALLDQLLKIEQDFAGMLRRRGILDAIEEALSEKPDLSQ
ncbi:DNA modification system-associated small protein [Bosea sp. NPDC055332]